MRGDEYEFRNGKCWYWYKEFCSNVIVRCVILCCCMTSVFALRITLENYIVCSEYQMDVPIEPMRR